MEHLLLVALALFAVAGMWVIVRAGMTTRLSISLHAAKTTTSQLVFGSLVFPAAVLICLSTFGWLLPHYNANVVSYILFGLVVLCLFVAALIPHIEGTWREWVHNAAAWGMVYVLPLTMAFILQWPLSALAWWVVVACVVVNSLLLLTALLFYKKCSPWFLYFQMTYLGLFFASLLVATYC